MAERILRFIFDLDDTLIPNSWLYNEPMWKCGLIISRALGPDCPYSTKLMARRAGLDGELVKTMHFSTDRFPKSWTMMYHHLCIEAGRTPDPVVERKLWRTASKFTLGPFRPYAGTAHVLTELRVQRHELFLVTAGPPDFQNKKIDQADLRPYFDPDKIYTVEEDKVEAFDLIFGTNPEICQVVGDSLRSDIEPAQKRGATGIWKPSSSWDYVNPDKTVTPDYTIATLSELLPLVSQLGR